MLMLALPTNVRMRGPRSWREGAGLLVQAEVVSRSEQLEAQLDGNVQVWHLFAVAVLVPVVKILDHFVEYHAAASGRQPRALAEGNRSQRNEDKQRRGRVEAKVRSSVVATITRNQPAAAGGSHHEQ